MPTTPISVTADVHRGVAAAVLALLTLPLLAILGVAPASASCLLDDRPLADKVAEAPTAFIGTVTALSQDGRQADVEVSEVWAGDVDAKVIVTGGPEGPPGQATSIDRTFTGGASYLFVPFTANGSASFEDSSCSPTREVDDEVQAARPASVSTPDPATASSGSDLGVWPWIAAGLLAASLLVAVPVMRDRRSN